MKRKKNLMIAILATMAMNCGGGGSSVSIPSPGGGTSEITKPPTGSIVGPDIFIGVVDSGFTEQNSVYGGRLTVIPEYNTDTYNNHGDFVSQLIIGSNIGIAKKSNIKIIGAGAAVTCPNGTNGCLDIKPEMHIKEYEMGARIFNKSYGTPGLNPLTSPKPNIVTNQMNKFFYDRASIDSLIIWATGNNSQVNPTVEASFPYFYPEMERGWMAVTALDSTGAIASYANRCGIAENWCLAALGDVTVGKESSKGTSFAAPRVTATAALVQDKYPWMDPLHIAQVILSTATRTGTGPDKIYGWGKLNIDKALNGPSLFDTRLTLHEGDFIAHVTSGEYIFSNDIAGDAGLQKEGVGTLKLTGNLTYTGENIVKEGLLIINGTSVTGVNVEPNGTFMSDGGTIYGNVVNQGTIQVGANGFQVGSNLVLHDGSSVQAIYGASINVTGKAILNQTTLSVNAIDSNGAPIYTDKAGSTMTVINATGGLENTFHSTEVGAFLGVDLNYDPNKVEATIIRKDIIDEVNSAYNGDITRVNVADNVEKLFSSLDTGNGSIVARQQAAILQSTSKYLLADTLDSLSGQIYGSAQALTFQQQEIIDRTLTNRLVSIGEQGRVGDNNLSFWMLGIGAKGKLKEDGYANANTKLYGSQGGVDKFFTDNLVLGLSAAYSESEAKFDRYAGKAEGQRYNFSLYGRFGAKDTPYYVMGRIGTGFINTDVSRYILPTNEILSVKHDDKSFSTYTEAGYKLSMNSFQLTPYLGLSYDLIKRGSFQESGSTLALQANSKKYDHLFGLVGVRVEKEFNVLDKSITFRAYASYQKSFKKEELDFEASFVADPDTKFDVKGIGLADEAIKMGIGARGNVTDKWSWTANYDMKIEDSTVKDNNVSIGLRYDF